MAADGRKQKIYLDTGATSYSYSDMGVERVYNMREDTAVPEDVVDLIPYVDADRVGTRTTPGSPNKAYYFCFRGGVSFNEIIPLVCGVAEKVGIPKTSAETLRQWMRRAEKLTMVPAWFQFNDGEITMYARLLDDENFVWGN